MTNATISKNESTFSFYAAMVAVATTDGIATETTDSADSLDCLKIPVAVQTKMERTALVAAKKAVAETAIVAAKKAVAAEGMD